MLARSGLVGQKKRPHLVTFQACFPWAGKHKKCVCSCLFFIFLGVPISSPYSYDSIHPWWCYRTSYSKCKLLVTLSPLWRCRSGCFTSWSTNDRRAKTWSNQMSQATCAVDTSIASECRPTAVNSENSPGGFHPWVHWERPGSAFESLSGGVWQSEPFQS